MTICLLVLAAAHAAADPAAEQLYREGRARFDLGNFDEACEKFQQSRALEERFGIVLALATCRERQGRYATAWDLYVEAKAFAVREKRDRYVGVVQRRATEIAGLRSFLTVAIPGKHRVPGLVVRRDGKDVPSASWDQELPIDSGDHVIEATAAGYAPLVLHVDVLPRGKVTVTVPALVRRARGDLGP